MGGRIQMTTIEVKKVEDIGHKITMAQDEITNINRILVDLGYPTIDVDISKLLPNREKLSSGFNIDKNSKV
jgi:hypothetical protein